MTEPTRTDPEGRQRHLDGIPLHREGTLRELGVLAAYLASPASDYMTGEMIIADGGGLAGGVTPTGHAPLIPMEP